MRRCRLQLPCIVIACLSAWGGGSLPATAGQQNSERESKRLLVLRVGKDNQGDLWDASFLQIPGDTTEVRGRVGDASLLAKMKQFGSVQVTVEPSPEASEHAVEETIAALYSAGIENINMLGPYFPYGGRLYYFESTERGITAPQLAIDRQELRRLAVASGAREKMPAVPGGEKILGYYLLFDETGRLVAIRQIPPAPPQFPEIEKVLAATKVLSPGRRDQKPVRYVTLVMINLK
jgi:hypothetical protein